MKENNCIFILTKRRKEEKTKKKANCLWLSSTASWKIKTMMTAERKKKIHDDMVLAVSSQITLR